MPWAQDGDDFGAGHLSPPRTAALRTSTHAAIWSCRWSGSGFCCEKAQDSRPASSISRSSICSRLINRALRHRFPASRTRPNAHTEQLSRAVGHMCRTHPLQADGTPVTPAVPLRRTTARGSLQPSQRRRVCEWRCVHVHQSLLSPFIGSPPICWSGRSAFQAAISAASISCSRPISSLCVRL